MIPAPFKLLTRSNAALLWKRLFMRACFCVFSWRAHPTAISTATLIAPSWPSAGGSAGSVRWARSDDVTRHHHSLLSRPDRFWGNIVQLKPLNSGK